MTQQIQEKTGSSQQTSTTPLWTVEEVAAYLQLAPETIRAMARRGSIPSVKVGKRVWRFQPGRIKEWLATRPEAAPHD